MIPNNEEIKIKLWTDFDIKDISVFLKSRNINTIPISQPRSLKSEYKLLPIFSVMIMNNEETKSKLLTIKQIKNIRVLGLTA